MERYYPFNAVDGDRTHDADDLAKIIGLMVTNGVVMGTADALKVSAGGQLNVTVEAGASVVAGRIGIAEVQKIFDVPTPSETLDRIDIVAVRVDYVKRLVEIVYLEGEPSDEPTAPALANDDNAAEMPLAEITVLHEAANITDTDIKDVRTAAEFMIPQNMERLQEAYRGMMRNIRQEQEQDFDTWFSELKATLDENAAGNIMNLLNEYRTHVFEVDLPASGWVRGETSLEDGSTIAEYSQTVDVPGLTAEMCSWSVDTDVLLDFSSLSTRENRESARRAWGLVHGAQCAAGKVQFVSEYNTKPSADIKAVIRVVR